MKKLFIDKKGVSLIWVLILLIVVGGLSAALLSSAVFNINFGSDEVNTSRAFYAAEAGVERTKAKVFSNYNNNVLNNFPITETLEYDSNFIFSYLVNYDSNEETFESIGYMGDDPDNKRNVQRIKFDLSYDALIEIAILIYQFDDSEDIDDYTWWKAAEKDFSRDNLALVEEMEKWEDFLSEYGIKFDEDYAAGVSFPHERGDEEDYDYLDDYKENWERKDMSRIEGGTYEDKLWYLTPDYVVEVGEEVSKWDEETEYSEGDYVYVVEDDEYYYYVSIEDNNSGIEPRNDDDYEDYWDEITGDEDDLAYEGNVTIDNSILVIDGSTEIRGNFTLNNTLVLVKDKIIMGGLGGGYDVNLNESLILSFNDDPNEDSLRVDGAPSITIEPLSLDDLWPGIDDIIVELKKKLDDSFFDFVLFNWRQVR